MSEWIKTQLSKFGTKLQEVAYPSGAVGSSYSIQYPVLIPLKVIYEAISRSTNRYETYRLLREVDPELYGAIDRISKMVRSSYEGFSIKVEDEQTEEQKELMEVLEEFQEEYKFKDLFYAITTMLLTYGDSLFLTTYSTTVGLTEFRSLPIEYITAIDSKDQIGNALSQIFYGNFFVMNEGTEKELTWPKEEITQFELNKIGSTVKDITGRYTYGVWSQSPVEGLRAVLLWKLSLKINDMLLRNHLVPRQHHKLNLEGFVPQNFPGDTLEERYEAAKTAAKTHIDNYKKNVATPLKEVDKSIITGADVEIGYLEPKKVSYLDPNPLIQEINKSIWAAIAPIEAAVTASGARSYAAQLVISSYAQMISEAMAEVIKDELLEVARRHIQIKYNGKYDEELDKIFIKTQLIMGIERGEIIRQGAVMIASGAITRDEFRDLVGYGPLTDKQWAEILIKELGPGRTGQFDRTTGDIMSDYIRRTDSDSRNPTTPESRREQQIT